MRTFIGTVFSASKHLKVPIFCIQGDLIEKGVMRRLPEGFDGNTCPYIFTWSNERPNKVRNIKQC